MEWNIVGRGKQSANKKRIAAYIIGSLVLKLKCKKYAIKTESGFDCIFLYVSGHSGLGCY